MKNFKQEVQSLSLFWCGEAILVIQSLQSLIEVERSFRADKKDIFHVRVVFVTSLRVPLLQVPHVTILDLNLINDRQFFYI